MDMFTAVDNPMEEVVEEAIVEAPVEEVVEEVVDVPVEESPAEEIVAEETPAEEAVEEKDEEAEEEVAADEETPDETPAEEALVLTADDPELETKTTEILDKYELPQEVQAVIDVLKAQANEPKLTAFTDYGTEDEVKVLMERQSFIDSSRPEDGGYRPNTDKYVEVIDDRKPDGTADWLYFDLAKSPSAKYEGITRFEEGIVDAFAKSGDTVQSALDRYKQTVEILRSGTMPEQDIPEFIPENVREAYWKLPRESRDELMYLDPEDDTAKIQGKVAELTLIQKGIEGDKLETQRRAQAEASERASFAADVQKTQQTFFSTFIDQQAKELSKAVTFSDDAKLQSLHVQRTISLFTQAIEGNESALKAITDAGIRFDLPKVQALTRDIEQASVDLVRHKRAVGSDGKPLNAVELNKATRMFEAKTREFQNFAKDVIAQEARLTATGKALDVEKAVEKQKIQPKARMIAKGTPTQAKTKEGVNPHPIRSEAWYGWNADREMEQMAKTARQYA